MESSSAPPTPGLYADPSVYDILHAPGTAEELDGVSRAAEACVSGRARVPTAVWLEPACGTGRLIRLAARRGRRIAGFDLEPGMVAYAWRSLVLPGLTDRAAVFQANMTEFADAYQHAAVSIAGGGVGVGVAFNTINTFRHLPSDDAARAHLDEMSRVLLAGGVYVVGLSLTVYGLEPPSEDVWKAARGRCKVKQVVQYEPPTAKDGGDRVERVYSHLTVERPSGTQHADSAYTLRAYSLEHWTELIERSALRVIGVFDADGTEAEPAPMGYRLWVLGKR